MINEFAYSYNNRGLGNIEEELKDIKHSIELDKDNSYGYRNLRTYNLDKSNFNETLKLSAKAKEIDPPAHMIDEPILIAQQN